MPMHDWTTVKAGIYHDFHATWLLAIKRALNNGLLPSRYYALCEQVTTAGGPDILTIEMPVKGPKPPPLKAGNGVHALAAERPAVGLLDRTRVVHAPRPRRRLAVRHVSTHNVVAVIELVSPANKGKRAELARFVEKSVAVLKSNVHLLVIDPFPPTRRDPAGLHGAIWAALGKPRNGRVPYTQPADRPLTAAAYSADTEVVAAVQAFSVGEAVPAMPLFLEPELYVTLPLEETYAAAWPDVPKVWRDVLEG